ncbi:MAG: hypothetical protein ACYCQJ_15710 [Nitrososphaerales archaeon]
MLSRETLPFRDQIKFVYVKDAVVCPIIDLTDMDHTTKNIICSIKPNGYIRLPSNLKDLPSQQVESGNCRFVVKVTTADLMSKFTREMMDSLKAGNQYVLAFEYEGSRQGDDDSYCIFSVRTFRFKPEMSSIRPATRFKPSKKV